MLRARWFHEGTHQDKAAIARVDEINLEVNHGPG